MSFNTALFLFLFLPFFLVLYFFAQPKLRSWVGLAGSLLFYSWGQLSYIPLMAAVIVFNYYLGLQIGRNRLENERRVRQLLFLGILVNVGLLAFFKLLTTYGTGLFGGLVLLIPVNVDDWLKGLIFPLGLSYISFQTASYLIDISNGSLAPEENLLNFSLYIFLFPKLLVGPITRYKSLAGQLSEPSPSRDQVAYGIRRFIQGLAKKVLIADILAKVVNAVFGQTTPMVMPEIAWLVLIAYALQIYFDFSGYTDMAIGLGEMLGFHFVENFNYPYISQSISDFWRRWHISLSSWFRDYVFYPLERRRIKFIGQPLNLLIVFLLTGLWHGVTTTFILWGLLHGVFMALESMFLARLLQKVFRPIRHIYALAAILLTWIWFRSPSSGFALGFMGRLMGNTEGITPLPFTQTSPLPFIEPTFWLAFVLGLFFVLPVKPFFENLIRKRITTSPVVVLPLTAAYDLVLLLLFVLSIGAMTSGKFLPGIYGSF